MSKEKPKNNPLKGQRNKDHLPKKQLKTSHYPSLAGLAIIVLLGIIIYTNSFDCSFHLDDTTSITNNRVIQDVSDLKALWNYSKTRFIPYYSFALNYRFDHLNVWGYHLVNLVIHLINACLVFGLTFLIFSSPALKDQPSNTHKYSIALFTALLFVSHPLATQSVTYIVQRMSSLVTMFYLLSLMLFVMARLAESSRRSQYLFFIGSLLSALLAMLTKENAFTLPFAIVLFEICFLQTRKIAINFKDYRVILIMSGLMGFIVIVLLYQSLNIFDPLPPDPYNDYRTITSQNYLLTQFSAILKYIQLLVLPVNQNLDYDFRLSNSIFELRTLLSFLVLLGLLILPVFLFDRNRIFSFGIGWFFLTLSIESSIIPIKDLIFEHRTYLPSFGFFLMLSCSIFLLRWNKYLSLSVLVVIIGSYCVLTYERNKVWENEFTLWDDVVLKSPNKARAYNNRGNYLMEENRTLEALSDFNKAIELKPDFAMARYNRGTIFAKENKNNQAMDDFNVAIKMDPVYAKAFNNRGMIFMKEQKFEEAYADFNRAIELEANFAEAYNNRGSALRNTDRYAEMRRDFEKAIDLRPDYIEAYYNRGNVFMKEKRYEEAFSDFSKAIELKPDLGMAYANRGIVNLKMGNKDNACSDFEKSAALGFQPAREVYAQNCQ